MEFYGAKGVELDATFPASGTQGKVALLVDDRGKLEIRCRASIARLDANELLEALKQIITEQQAAKDAEIRARNPHLFQNEKQATG